MKTRVNHVILGVDDDIGMTIIQGQDYPIKLPFTQYLEVPNEYKYI